jgi:hypothetical protein
MFADRQWILEGMIGLLSHCPSLPSRIDFDVGATTITPLSNKVIATGDITLLKFEDIGFYIMVATHLTPQ